VPKPPRDNLWAVICEHLLRNADSVIVFGMVFSRLLSPSEYCVHWARAFRYCPRSGGMLVRVRRSGWLDWTL
jgi:hypothetical protein